MKQKPQHWLRNNLVRVALVHLVIALIYIGQTIAYDAAKLITPDAVLDRWYAAAALSATAAAIWYIARSKVSHPSIYKVLTVVLILADIALAAFNIYTQRGMASRAVALFFIPIIVASILLSRVALFATATLCVAAYTTASVAYFVHNFNEGYKIELYGEILFYSSMFMVAAALLWFVIKTKHHR